jgi:hypothetical protein
MQVTVVILTHDRRALFFRALHSVLYQEFPGIVSVIIGFDRCSYKEEVISFLLTGSVKATSFDFSNISHEELPMRLSVARNIGRSLCDSTLLCYLDDDNYFAAGHLRTLISTLVSTRAQAAHSWRAIFKSDGSPWLERTFPWSGDRTAEILYHYYVHQGVFVPGTNSLRDITMLPDGSLGMVDTSAWLFDLEALPELKWPVERTHIDAYQNLTEDDLLLRNLVKQGVRVACTRRETLCYTLGGYSNLRSGGQPPLPFGCITMYKGPAK